MNRIVISALMFSFAGAAAAHGPSEGLPEWRNAEKKFNGAVAGVLGRHHDPKNKTDVELLAAFNQIQGDIDEIASSQFEALQQIVRLFQRRSSVLPFEDAEKAAHYVFAAKMEMLFGDMAPRAFNEKVFAAGLTAVDEPEIPLASSIDKEYFDRNHLPRIRELDALICKADPKFVVTLRNGKKIDGFCPKKKKV